MNNRDKKILIIEDETALLYALQAELAQAGYKTICAVSSDEAMEKIKKNDFDVILLDLILPGKIDGFEFLKQIKIDENTKNIPVIVISNLGEKENVEKAMRLGAQDYLIKTEHSLEEILKKIKQILEK